MITRILLLLKLAVAIVVLSVGRPSVGLSFPVTGGDVVLTPAPPSLEHSAFESNDTIFLIEEQSSFSLPSILFLDVDSTSGHYDENSDLIPGALPAGTIVNSHILHFDPIGSANPAIAASGSVTFGQPIIGLILTSQNLTESDALGATGTAYGGRFRGFELVPSLSVGDGVTISADHRSISVDFGVTANFDQLRVLTSVPEPSTAMLALVVFSAGLSLLRTRRRGICFT